MAVLTSVLDDALSGQGRLVMLAGEPGIGKTRTAQELASLAEAKGAQVLWGRCYEEEGTPPYWAWVQAIRSYVQEVAAYAWDEALAHFERGLVARDVTLSGTEAASDEEAAALLFGLGRARVATTEPLHPLQDALDTLRRAFDYYVDAGDVEHAVAIAEYPYFPRFGYSYGSSQLVARALSLVPSGSHAAGRLLFRYGLILGVEEGDSAGAREAMESAFAIAEREEDTDLKMRILAASARLDRFGLGMEETLRKSQRAIELAVRLKDLRTEAAARYEAGIALRNMGDLVESEKHAAAMLDASERLRDRQLLILALNINAGGSRRKGDWRAAREYCLRGLEVSGDGDSRLPLAYLAEIGYQVGSHPHFHRLSGRVRGC